MNAPVGEALAFLGDALRLDEPMGRWSTYRVGGPARYFAEIDDDATLARLAHATAALGSGLRTLVVGRGSNLLVAERGFDGLVVHLGESFSSVELDPGGDGRTLVVGGATSLPVAARRSVALGLSGFEWAVGVPGSIGGAVRMNAGGHGSDMSEVLLGVRVVDLSTGEDVQMDRDALHLGYRSSAVRDSMIVTRASLGLGPGDPVRSEDLLRDIVRWRREHQPGGANAGSVFTNPAGDSAGRLIDAAGCKGLRIGTAEVSTKHANFIQADPGGLADDVYAVMVEVRRRVQQHAQVELHAETVLVGFDEAVS